MKKKPVNLDDGMPGMNRAQKRAYQKQLRKMATIEREKQRKLKARDKGGK